MRDGTTGGGATDTTQTIDAAGETARRPGPARPDHDRYAAGRAMTYRQYEQADAARERLTRAGMAGPLTAAEVAELRAARERVLCYLDYTFGPEQAATSFAKPDPRSAGAVVRRAARAGRLGRLLYRR